MLRIYEAWSISTSTCLLPPEICLGVFEVISECWNTAASGDSVIKFIDLGLMVTCTKNSCHSR